MGLSYKAKKLLARYACDRVHCVIAADFYNSRNESAGSVTIIFRELQSLLLSTVNIGGGEF